MSQTRIQLDNPHIDERGLIQVIAHEHHGSVAIIKSNAGSERANHYHKEDFHYCYVVKGIIEYYERPANQECTPIKQIFYEGDFFYTPPMVEHCMYFPENTVFATLGGRTREQEDYENDLVRISSLKEMYHSILHKEMLEKGYVQIDDCCLCGSTDIHYFEPILSSGLANNLEDSPLQSATKAKIPLQLAICKKCGHIQLAHEVNPASMFRYYNYESSISSTFREHFQKMAKTYTRYVSQDSIPITISELNALDIGSNDGYFLDCLKELGWNTFGVEPATNLYFQTSSRHCVVNNFFDETICDTDLGKRRYSLITANNVFAHSRKLRTIAKNVSNLLTDNGVFIFEVQYGKVLVESGLFDMIYHEHTSYHYITPLLSAMKDAGLKVTNVENINTHGGSIRVYCHKLSQVAKPEYLASDIRSIDSLISDLSKFLLETRDKLSSLSDILLKYIHDDYTVYGYTAPAKATTLISGLTEEARNSIRAIIDDAPYKNKKYIPTTTIQVLSSSEFINSAQYLPIKENKKILVVIFAWNLGDTLFKKLIENKLFGENVLYLSPLPKPFFFN